MENLTNDTPPKKGFLTPCTVRFPPRSGVSARFFLYKNLRQSRPEALLEGSKNFRESAFSGTFSSPPYVLHPPTSRPRHNLCGIDVFCLVGLTKVTFVPNISGTTIPSLPPIPNENTEIATLYDTM